MNKKGFTLVEIIFSIAFLCMVSIIMLQLLVTSYDMENEIDTIEVANLLLMNEIEVIKGESSSELSHVEKYYNIDWQETEGDDRFFKLSLIVEELQPGLYSIAGTVMGDELLVSLETKHYYNDKE